LFICNVVAFSVTKHRMKEWYVNDELERIGKGA
jgi:hypothetical protein